jgi:hypothetical protein
MLAASPRLQPVLAFDEASHTYTLDGRKVPSVTGVLKALPNDYAMVDPAVLEQAAGLGRDVHKLIELDLADRLDVNSLDDELVDYLLQWQAFRATSGFQPILSEARVASPRYRYAGTLDLFGRLNGRLVLIDAKRTAAVPRSAGPQTAGYELALRESRPDLLPVGTFVDRFALHLKRDKWQLVPFRDTADQRVFLSALTIHNWSATR